MPTSSNSIDSEDDENSQESLSSSDSPVIANTWNTAKPIDPSKKESPSARSKLRRIKSIDGFFTATFVVTLP
jgi:hypothetical protein